MFVQYQPKSAQWDLAPGSANTKEEGQEGLKTKKGKEDSVSWEKTLKRVPSLAPNEDKVGARPGSH